MVWCIMFLLLLCVGIVSFLTGPGYLGTPEVLRLRILRLVLGILAGGVLSLTGAALQGLLRNPLVDPFTLGVSSGAAFGVSVMTVLGVGTSVLKPVAGFAGAMLTIVAVYLLAQSQGRLSVTGLVLAGVIVSLFFSSLVMLLIVLSRQTLGHAVYILMGHLGVVFTRGSLLLFAVSAVIMVCGCGLLLTYARALDIVSAGEEAALSLGVDTARMTRAVFLISSLLVGLVVSFTGAISFVGLVVPHLVRMMFGPRHSQVLPGSFVLGGAILVGADVLARSLVPGGLPLSIVTALVGVPFFIYLLQKRL